jgi:hypothetical protein
MCTINGTFVLNRNLFYNHSFLGYLITDRPGAELCVVDVVADGVALLDDVYCFLGGLQVRWVDWFSRCMRHAPFAAAHVPNG